MDEELRVLASRLADMDSIDIGMFDHESEDRNDMMERIIRMELLTSALDGELDLEPDTYLCERIFLYNFLTDEMLADFPVIAADFLRHERDNLGRYSGVVYADTNPKYFEPRLVFGHTILNLMMGGVHQGSTYSRDLFLNLYKTYYKREYRQLKRFQRISREEILAIAEAEDYIEEFENLCRIYCICNLWGIELDLDAKLFYPSIDRMAEIYLNLETPEHRIIDCDSEEIQSEIDRLFGGSSSLSMENWLFETGEFFECCLSLYNFCSDYIDTILGCDDDLEVYYRNSASLLRETEPERDGICKEDLAHHSNIVRYIAAFNQATESWKTLLDYALGVREEGKAKFYSPSQTVSVRPIEKKPETKRVECRQDLQEKENLTAELDRLRLELHKLERKEKELTARLYDTEKQLEKQKLENAALNAKIREEQGELFALREHVYLSTENVEETCLERDVSKEITELKKHRIAVIGGHPIWVKKLKVLFPDWKYVSPNVSATVDGAILSNVEKAYFFTDTMGHRTYTKFVSAARERKVPIGYIHGVNIENNILQLYKELKSDNCI